MSWTRLYQQFHANADTCCGQIPSIDISEQWYTAKCNKCGENAAVHRAQPRINLLINWNRQIRARIKS